MRIGSDALKLPDSKLWSPIEQLQQASDQGLDGLFFRTIQHMSMSLDISVLREIRAKADELGMYLEAGLGKVNPYGLAENPEIRDLGDGDTVLGFTRMMQAAADIEVRELWVETANHKPYPGRFAYDRFRTDAPWADQLVAVEKLLGLLAPVARDIGIHMNLETHEEITTFELVRLVEAIGPDVLGITFDTANVLQRGEHPVRAAQRIAPYVRQTHMKDAGLFRATDGLNTQMRPCGQGVVDFEVIIPLLYKENPNLNLSLEVTGFDSGSTIKVHDPHGPAIIPLHDEAWLDGHPDLNVRELLAYLELVDVYQQRIATGEIVGYEEYNRQPGGLDEAWRFVSDSVAHLQKCAHNNSIVLSTRESHG